MSVHRKPTFCPHCHSDHIIRKGSRENEYRRVPTYRCKSCYKYFSATAITRVKYPPRIIMLAIT